MKGVNILRRKIIIFLMIFLGASIGAFLLPFCWKYAGQGGNQYLNNSFVSGCIGAIIFFIISFFTAGYVELMLKKVDSYLSKVSLINLLIVTVSVFLGLAIGGLVSIPFFLLKVPILSTVLPIILMVGISYAGFYVGTTKREEFLKLIRSKKDDSSKGSIPVLKHDSSKNYHKFKILDTSVIIDGRIYDIANTGFLEGILVVPNFVLFELQYIADSSDSLKRVRGRRGLDILNTLQKEDKIALEMYDQDFDDIKEVDAKLLKLAKLLDGVVVTNDYNLNKVAEFQHVPVLNINELGNAVKPVSIPGEKLDVVVVKDGTEREQGVAYLDDGTMIVVEDGRYFMNEHIEVVVTSTLQTAAGRMIFARVDHVIKNISEAKV